MKVVEIFNSIDGEGIRSGELATFIRLAGCNLRCSYCDTPYALKDTDAAEELTPEQIVDRVKATGYHNITITGGEPLIHKDIEKLLRLLVTAGFNVNVETNGSVFIGTSRSYINSAKLFFTVDYKCPSSGMEDKMFLENFSAKSLTLFDNVKFVVDTMEDLEKAREITQKHLKYFAGTIFISPVFGKIELSQIVDFMKTYKLEQWKLQVQLHKIIWDPEERGV